MSRLWTHVSPGTGEGVRKGTPTAGPVSVLPEEETRSRRTTSGKFLSYLFSSLPTSTHIFFSGVTPASGRKGVVTGPGWSHYPVPQTQTGSGRTKKDQTREDTGLSRLAKQRGQRFEVPLCGAHTSAVTRKWVRHEDPAGCTPVTVTESRTDPRLDKQTRGPCPSIQRKNGCYDDIKKRVNKVIIRKKKKLTPFCV